MITFNGFQCRKVTAVLTLACAVLASGNTVQAEDANTADDAKQKILDVAAVKSLKAPSFVVPKMGGIRMILIKPGTFTMGSPANEVGRGEDETFHRKPPETSVP